MDFIIEHFHDKPMEWDLKWPPEAQSPPRIMPRQMCGYCGKDVIVALNFDKGLRGRCIRYFCGCPGNENPKGASPFSTGL